MSYARRAESLRQSLLRSMISQAAATPLIILLL